MIAKRQKGDLEVDAALVAQINDVLKQAAIEEGPWSEKCEANGGVGINAWAIARGPETRGSRLTITPRAAGVGAFGGRRRELLGSAMSAGRGSEGRYLKERRG